MGVEVKEGGKEWKGCLQRILGALLKTSVVTSTKMKMALIGAQVMECCEREGKTLVDFAGEMDRALLFAEWQAKLFGQDTSLLAEISSAEKRFQFFSLTSGRSRRPNFTTWMPIMQMQLERFQLS